MTDFMQGFLGLDDGHFFEDGELSLETKFDILTHAPGLLLDGPRALSLLEHPAPRYRGSRACDAAEADRIDLRSKAALLVHGLDDGVTLATWAFRAAHGPQPTAPLPPDDGLGGADEGPCERAEHFQLDLRDRLEGLELEPGTWRAWMLLFDTASNAVTTTVTRGEPSADPAVRAVLASRRPRRWAGPPSPPAGDPLPSYAADEATPPTPERGVALSVPRVVVGERGQRLVLHGSFRLPVRPSEVVGPPDAAEQARRAELEADGAPAPPRPTVVVSITLVLVGDTDSAPELVRLSVPSWDAHDPDDEHATVSGAFHIDLRSAASLGFQTYAVWCLAGGELSGPSLTALVDPGLLQAR